MIKFKTTESNEKISGLRLKKSPCMRAPKGLNVLAFVILFACTHVYYNYIQYVHSNSIFKISFIIATYAEL